MSCNLRDEVLDPFLDAWDVGNDMDMENVLVGVALGSELTLGVVLGVTLGVALGSELMLGVALGDKLRLGAALGSTTQSLAHPVPQQVVGLSHLLSALANVLYAQKPSSSDGSFEIDEYRPHLVKS